MYNSNIEPEPRYTIEEAAEFVGVDKRSLYLMTQFDRIPSRKDSKRGNIYFLQEDLDEFPWSKASEIQFLN